MYTVIRKHEVKPRKVSAHKLAYNLITKEITPDVSLAVIEAMYCNEKTTSDYNRIYFVIEGTMTLTFEKEKITMHPGDSCYVTKGETYGMIGTFRTVIVSQPAFGT